jgi:peptidoglycan/xylan/chitin deacetylase (PgdA/CDA1 family)
MKTSPTVRSFGLAVSIVAASCFAALLPHGESFNKLQPPCELERDPARERQIALTFDAEGSNEDLPRLLRVLRNEGVTATFFLTGKWAGEFPACATQIVDGGHIIGNHTWGHKDLTSLTDSEIAQEILRADDRFVSAFGCRYFPLFRAPYGQVNNRVLGVVDYLGFRAVRWSIDTLDALEGRKTASFIEDRVARRTDEELFGAIVLMHVGYPETVDALPLIIHNLRERGFEFVPVSSWFPNPQPVLTGAQAQDTTTARDSSAKRAFQPLMIQPTKAGYYAPPPKRLEHQLLGAAAQVVGYPKDSNPATCNITKP